MNASRKLLAITIASVVAVALVPAVAWAAGTNSGNSQGHMVVHVVEHAVTDTVQQFHAPANSLGDVLAFHNPVYDSANSRRAGTDNGYCIRTVATGKTEWECSWTTLLAKGSLTVQGPYFDDGTDTTLTVTGGTGSYTGAQGSMLLHATGSPVGSEYDFVFSLTGH
jgi:allene oxide cyclase